MAPREPSPIQEIVFLEQITEAIENSQRRLRCALRPEELNEVMLQPPQAQSTPRLVIDHSEEVLQPQQQESLDRSRTSNTNEEFDEMMLQPSQAQFSPRLDIDHTEEVPQPQQQESLHHSRTSNTNKISELLRNQYDEDLDTEKDFHLYLTDSVSNIYFINPSKFIITIINQKFRSKSTVPLMVNTSHCFASVLS